ncbi:MAG: hypothetical protein ACI976_000506 [Aureispira sp.]|jgi:hypothetical protein
MFKSKTDFNAFDKNNEKVDNTKITKVKGFSKAGTKKLMGKIGERTSYHLILEYFVDDKGKVEGHFLDLGENKKLRKHFDQVEMKSGKLDKSMSETPKKACAGEVYIEEIKGSKVVHFQPSESSKVPKAQWPKVLKTLKPFLNGLKAVVVLGGIVIGAEVEDEDEDESTSPESATEDNTQQTDVDSTSVILTIKELVLGITGILKEELPKAIVPNIKAKKVSQQDADITNDLFSKLNKLTDMYDTAGSDIQQKIQKHYDSILNQVPKLEKIRTALNNLLAVSEENKDSSTEEPKDTEEVKQLKELLAYATKETDAIWENFNKTRREISKAVSQVIEGGDQLLKALFN